MLFNEDVIVVQGVGDGNGHWIDARRLNNGHVITLFYPSNITKINEIWPQMFLIKCLVAVAGYLNHFFILVGGEVLEVVVAWVHRAIFNAHLVVKVRAGGFAGIPYETDHIAPVNFLTRFNIKIVHMGI